MPAARPWATVVAALAGLLLSAGLVVLVGISTPAPDGAEPVVEAGRSRAEAARDRDRIVRDAPAIQSAALADGRVTVAEYEAAVRRSRQCLAADLAAARPSLTSQPPTFTGPTWSADRFTYSYDFRLTIDDLDPRPIDRACQARNSRAVEALFHVQRWADPAYRVRTSTAFHACLDRAGLPARSVRGPRARFEAVLADASVDDQAAIEARKCIGALPSIGDLNP